MKNILLTIITILLLTGLSFAQQNQYEWRLGAYGGVSTYYGDLNSRVLNANKFILDDLWDARDYITYGASLERVMKKGFGMKLMWSQGKITSNDRAVNFNKELRTENDFFDRSLNFSSKLMDAGLLATLYTDNGKIFSDEAFLSPYFSFGVGMTYFDVSGDLFLEDGRRYYYWSDNTIRDKSETAADASTAEIIEQDGIFETNLRELGTGEDYSQFSFNIPAAIGLKFRLGDRFNLNLETMVKYSFTDYLDDVSGDYKTGLLTQTQAYAINPNNQAGPNRGRADDKVNDFYAFTSVSLHYNFGFRKDAFIAPIIYTNLNGVDPVAKVETREVEVTEEPTIQPIPKEMEAEVTVAPSTKEEMEVPSSLENKETEITEEPTIRPIPKEMEAEVTVAPSTKEEMEVPSSLENKETEIEEETTIRPIPKEMEAEVIVAPSTKVEMAVPNTLPEMESVIVYEAAPILLPEPQEVILLGVKEDQLELTKLETELIKIETGEQDAKELKRIEEELESITEDLTFFDEYNKEIAVKADEEAALPENVEIRDNTLELREELERVKAELATAKEVVNQPKASQDKESINRLNVLLEENNKKIALLEKEVASMKKEQSAKIDAAARQESKEKQEKAKTAEAEPATLPKVEEAISTKIILEEPPATAPAEVKYYSNEVSRIKEEVGNMEAAPENSEIDEAYLTKLKERTTFIDAQLEALGRTENSAEIKKYNKQLKADNRQLNIAIRNLERKEDLAKRLREKQAKSEKEAQERAALEKSKPTTVIPTSPTFPSTPTTPATPKATPPTKTTTPTPKTTETVKEAPVKVEKTTTAPPRTTIIVPEVNNEDKAEIEALKKEIEALRSQETGKQASIDKVLAKITELEAELKKPAIQNNSTNTKYLEDAISALQKTVDELQEENRRLAAASAKPAVTPAPVVINRTVVETPAVVNAIRGHEVTNVYFDSGLSIIKPEFFGKLDKLASLMLRYPEIIATLKGYTDKSGNPDLNFRLSRHRAAQVKAYLLKKGVDESRIDDNYFGDAAATAKNDPYSRRVEVTLFIN